MTVPAFRLSAVLLLLPALAAVAGTATQAARSTSRPYELAVNVIWGEPVGPESWREDLERTLATELVRRRCFASIERFDPERPEAAASTTLVLRVAIDEFLERSTFDVGIATLQSPDASPDVAQSQFAEVKAMFDVAMDVLPGGATVRSKRFGDRATHRPRLSEDPRYEARTRFLESVRRTIANFACKGSAEKFERELARARAAALQDDD